MSEFTLVYKSRRGRTERTKTLTVEGKTPEQALADLVTLHQQIAASGRTDYIRPLRFEVSSDGE